MRAFWFSGCIILALIGTISCLPTRIGFQEEQRKDFGKHLEDAARLSGSYLMLLFREPTQKIKPYFHSVSVLILQCLLEFLQNHELEIYDYYRSESAIRKLTIEETQLFAASKSFNRNFLLNVHTNYGDAIKTVQYSVREFFINTPKEVAKQELPIQATTRLVIRIMVSLQRQFLPSSNQAYIGARSLHGNKVVLTKNLKYPGNFTQKHDTRELLTASKEIQDFETKIIEYWEYGCLMINMVKERIPQIVRNSLGKKALKLIYECERVLNELGRGKKYDIKRV